MKTNLLILYVPLLVAVHALAQETEQNVVFDEAFSERVPFDLTAKAIEPVVPVSLDMDAAFREGVNIHALPRLSEAEIEAADQRGVANFPDALQPPPRVGLRRTVAPGPLSIQRGSALTTALAGEERVWTLAVRSPGAHQIRLHISDFDVGQGRMIVYSTGPAGLIVRGPYTRKGPERDGDFWTPSLPGDEVFIEITGTTEPRFEIVDIIHFDRNPYAPEPNTAAVPLPCHLDVNCYSDSVNATVQAATGAMTFLCDAGTCHICTGTVLNDKDLETEVPYFLTARHCLRTQAAVDTLEVVWRYESDYCDGPVPHPSTLPRNTGGTLVTTYGENDMTFIRLAGDLPPGTGFAGWSTSTSTGQYGVHHPRGSWKRVVFLDDVGFCPGCLCYDAMDYDYYNRTNGLTEPASSGSGVFNGSAQLVGQLRGVCSACCDPDNRSCSNIDDYWGVYGEFETTYDRIKRYLYIGGTMHVDANASGIFGQNGTPALPYLTVGAGVEAAWDGLRIKIHAASYPETLTISKQVTLLAEGGTATIGG